MNISPMNIPDRRPQYRGATHTQGPLVFVERERDAGLNDRVEILDACGNSRLGRVLDLSDHLAAVQVLEGYAGLSTQALRARFLGKSVRLKVDLSMLGRVFDGLGRPVDGCPVTLSDESRDVHGLPMDSLTGLRHGADPSVWPTGFIQTGISAIDGLNMMALGQNLPIFSGDGLPHDRLSAQIVRQARLLDQKDNFSIVFAAMGVEPDLAQYFIQDFERSGALAGASLFLSMADAPAMERLLTPRMALALAEHLAFDCGRHVLVVLTDMTKYCESLREVATDRGEIPGRKGYPGYLYSDLASLYGRAGCIDGAKGSITQMAILTMPSDDITHPVPDLTGYITKGQILLDRELFQRGIYPPIAGMSGLPCHRQDGAIGWGDPQALATRLCACYAYGKRVQGLADAIGKDGLNELDKLYLKFCDAFEMRFLNQGEHEHRSMEFTLALGLDVLSILPPMSPHRNEGLVGACSLCGTETEHRVKIVLEKDNEKNI